MRPAIEKKSGVGPILTEQELEASSIVANCQMNRERELRGGNGYERDLGIDPVSWLKDLGRATWLDMCCGTGRALMQASGELGPDARLVGVDLVSYFWPGATDSSVEFIVSPVREYTPTTRFDLITCVHGLHYVGDKLGALLHLRSLLLPGGRLVANLDLDHIVIDGRVTPRKMAALLRSAGYSWNGRRHLVTFDRPDLQYSLPSPDGDERAPTTTRPNTWPRFLGARLAGPNYTGQAAVESIYSS